MDKYEISDSALDQILGLASNPPHSPDFVKRVLAEATSVQDMRSNVIAFPARKPKSNASWLIGLPLAACLMLGVWLGVNGQGVDILPSSSNQTATTDTLSPSGVDDIENLKLEDLS